MNPVSVASALICFACAAQNFTFWKDYVSRFIGFGCIAGGVFCLWIGVR